MPQYMEKKNVWQTATPFLTSRCMMYLGFSSIHQSCCNAVRKVTANISLNPWNVWLIISLIMCLLFFCMYSLLWICSFWWIDYTHPCCRYVSIEVMYSLLWVIYFGEQITHNLFVDVYQLVWSCAVDALCLTQYKTQFDWIKCSRVAVQFIHLLPNQNDYSC